MGGSHRLVARLAVGAIVVTLLTGFGGPTPKTSLEREVGKRISAKGSPYRQYGTVRDATGMLEVKAPKQWKQVSGRSQFARPGTGERYGAGLLVSPNLDKLRNTFDVAGFRLTATTELPDNPKELLLANASNYDGACTPHDLRDYNDGRYEGIYEFFTKCNGTKTGAVVVSAISQRDGVFIIVAAQVRTRADLAAIDRAIRSSKLT